MNSKIFHPFVCAFGSRAFYAKVAQEWTGVCLGFLLLLVVVTTVPTVIQMHLDLNRSVRDEAPYLIEQIPTVTVSNGEVKIDKESPYEIKSKTGEVLAIFDTRDDSAVLTEAKAPLIVTRKRIAVTGSNQQTRLVDAGAFGDLMIDRAKVDGWVHAAARWLAPCLFVLLVVILYILRIVQTLIYAALGMLYCNLRNLPMNFATMMRLAVMALTPVVLINTVLALVKISPPLWTLLSIVATLAYLGFAIQSAMVKSEVAVN